MYVGHNRTSSSELGIIQEMSLATTSSSDIWEQAGMQNSAQFPPNATKGGQALE